MSTYWSISIEIPGALLGQGKEADKTPRTRTSLASTEHAKIEIEDITPKVLKRDSDSRE